MPKSAVSEMEINNMEINNMEDPANPSADVVSKAAAEASSVESSLTFKMSSASFVKEMIFRYGGIWLGTLSMLAVAGIALGIAIDLRWLIIALMVIFLLMPMAVAFIYYYYGLRKECYVNTVPHKLILTSDGLTARMFFSNYDENNSEQDNIRTRDEHFPFSQMHPYRIGNDSAIIPLRTPLKGFIWIPLKAYSTPEHLRELLEIVDKHTLDT